MTNTVTWTSKIPDLAGRIIPLAAAMAVNRTVEEAQARVRQNFYLAGGFTIRSPSAAQFLKRMIKIRPGERATASNPVATIRVEGPEQNKTNILGRQETEHTSSAPLGTEFFLPTAALRPSAGAVIPRNMFPARLGFLRGAMAGLHVAASLRRGAQRTYLIPGVGIFQRTGPTTSVLIWSFKPTVHLSARLKFGATVRAVVTERLARNLVEFIRAELQQTTGRLTTGQQAQINAYYAPSK